jgi:hypothetical protein
MGRTGYLVVNSKFFYTASAIIEIIILLDSKEVACFLRYHKKNHPITPESNARKES